MVILELKKRVEEIIGKTDAAELLKFLLDTDSTGLILRANEQARDATVILALKYADMIKSGKPLQHILGEWEFMGLKIKVNKNVLIPRADTETLVEQTLRYIQGGERIIELCTGSGCIAAAMLNNADCFVTAVELSRKAIKVAKENLKDLTNGNYEIVNADVLLPPGEQLLEKYDILVSNPPYIKSDVIPTLDKNVQNEPVMALDGGEDGLDFYRSIAKEWKRVLKKGGKILLEIGFDQADKVSDILLNNGFYDIKKVCDGAENDRVIIGTLKT